MWNYFLIPRSLSFRTLAADQWARVTERPEGLMPYRYSDLGAAVLSVVYPVVRIREIESARALDDGRRMDHE